MQQQERDLIADLFGRLQQFENQQRDQEAERLIASYVGHQPASPYLLVQTALVQEEALKQAKARIAELEGKASGQGSFLGNAPRGPWGSPAAAPAPAAVPAPAPAPAQPWGAAPQAPAGGGFLRTALTTAAGVAGGALLFEGIRSMFGHNTQALAQPSQGVMDNTALSQPLSDNSPLMPPDNLSPADLAQDDGSADDYDLTSDDSGFDSSDDDI
ncbi:MAG: DUF2076 domain-containing protein [Reyranella sp.]|uniref:DUF2076 domain-containing protein n=1 Tax=Reyranella sp. TaxID=1929291 RepID=UPI001ACD049C|nr:DUF2076 domain-containing protein [Reyranella sp.]MBN9091653.1 DUF2076 domain-containing protein [Reyranella sp.]